MNSKVIIFALVVALAFSVDTRFGCYRGWENSLFFIHFLLFWITITFHEFINIAALKIFISIQNNKLIAKYSLLIRVIAIYTK